VFVCFVLVCGSCFLISFVVNVLCFCVFVDVFAGFLFYDFSQGNAPNIVRGLGAAPAPGASVLVLVLPGVLVLASFCSGSGLVLLWVVRAAVLQLCCCFWGCVLFVFLKCVCGLFVFYGVFAFCF